VNARAISFVLLSSAIMMTAIILQGIFNPPPADPANQVAEQTVEAAETGPDQTELEKAENSGLLNQSSQEPTVGEQVAPPAPNDDLDTPGDPSNTAKQDTETQDAQSGTASSLDAAASSDPEPAPEDAFVTIGSLDPSGNDRYLITINLNGGTIHRMELNFRDKKSGRYLYRDLEHSGGFLGCLDCVDVEKGIKIRTVGPGTPAALAKSNTTAGGLKPGDFIVSLNGEPVTTAEEFQALLAEKTQPRSTVDLVVRRDDAEIEFAVSLTDKPIELLSPEHSRLDPGYDYAESFVFSLLKVMPAVDQTWPDLDRGMRNRPWELVGDETNSKQEIELKYTLSEADLQTFALDGPITVVKRYRLPELQPQQIYEIGSRTFHLDLDVEIQNGSEQPVTLAYELDGPTGTPKETWWYANKIHGRSTAIGYAAGARDVVGSNGKQPFVFWGCPEIVKGSLESPPDVKYICDPTIDNPEARDLNFVGVDTLYFSVSLLPETAEGEQFSCNGITADINGGEIPDKNVKLQKLVDCTFRMAKTVNISAGESYRQTFEIFGGPKDEKILALYGLDDLRTFGWFAWCSKPLMWLLHFFHTITFGFSYGIAIIMLTILVRSLMIPVSRKAALNAQMMQHLQPQMKAIADKYKDDMEKRAAAQRELFKKHNYNPFGGCFMMFFQLPIFIGLYRGLSVDIALRDQPLIPGISWCSNLSGPDQLMYWKDWMPSMLADETGWLGPFLNILPLATMFLFIAQQKLFMPPAADDQQKMMQKMMTFMMIFMGVLFFKVSSGLCLYFITSSIWGIAERKLLPKPVLATDELPEFDVNEAGKATKKKIVQNRKEEKAALRREEELVARKRRNAERKKKLKERGI
jgi:YidC/Oxa1 family membrane protein insertase